MSLKAKIEAVIYAADEPVSLAQLATIFADEALAAERADNLLFDGPASESNDSARHDAPTAVSPVPEESQPETADSTEQPALPMEDAESKKQTRLREREIRTAIEKIVDELIAEYASGDRGIEIREIAGGYRMATKAEYHDAVRSFVKSLKPQMKLSLQALETLAVVAYKQPVTAPEISEIRGVDTSGVLGGLMARKLITTAGRKQVIGRPILYKTTKEFLLRFGLKDLAELPSIEEFEKMAADMAADLAEDTVGDEALDSANRLESSSDTDSAGESGSKKIDDAELNEEIGGSNP
jgi:segregation and condensation protein B